MEGFSYTNIFETKGIEYLIIIAFLLMIIPFWVVINRQAGISKRIKNAFGVLSAGILNIPQGLFYSRNHTWTHLEKSGTARVGLDDFFLHVTGGFRFSYLKNPGDVINKGDLLAGIDQDGKYLKVYSPISGNIIKTNRALIESPDIINEDPYGKGWICMIKPTEWISETGSYYLAENATAWSIQEVERLKIFLSASLNKNSGALSLAVMQDGGELCDQPLKELPGAVWQEFQATFLNKP
jgi:glycine cleavage system H protein